MNGTELREPLPYIDDKKIANNKFETHLKTLFPEDRTLSSLDWLFRHHFKKLNDDYWFYDIPVGYLEPENPKAGNLLYVKVEAHRKEYFKKGIWTSSSWTARVRRSTENKWVESEKHEDVRECLLDIQKTIFLMKKKLDQIINKSYEIPEKKSKKQNMMELVDEITSLN